MRNTENSNKRAPIILVTFKVLTLNKEMRVIRINQKPSYRSTSILYNMSSALYSVQQGKII